MSCLVVAVDSAFVGMTAGGGEGKTKKLTADG
jgi:hypothetical protein